MNHVDRIRRPWLVVLVFSFGVLLSPAVAHADASCSSLLSGTFNNLQQNGGFNYFDVTVTKDVADPGCCTTALDALDDVTYSIGTLSVSGPYLYGGANLEFSDRINRGGPTDYQPFDATSAESIQLWLTETGTLWIWNNNRSYWIVDEFDMSCTSGGLVSTYISGLGLVTVAIRAWVPPIG
jgi:hypothetical protein